MSAHPAGYVRHDNDLLDLLAQLHTVEDLLRLMSERRQSMALDKRVQAKPDLYRLVIGDVNELHEIRMRVEGARARLGAATAAFHAGYFPGTVPAEHARGGADEHPAYQSKEA